MELWKNIKAMGNPAKGHHPPLHPSRILAALEAAAKRDQKVFREKTVIPDHYTVNLSDRDLTELDPILNAFSDELTDALQQHARRKGYTFNTPDVSIIFQAHHLVTPGSVAVAGRFRPPEAVIKEPTDTSRQSKATVKVRTIILNIAPDNPAAARIKLDPGVYTIGRGNDADIRLPADNRMASKHHCRITVEEDTVRLMDLKSANGTVCNQIPVTGTVFLKHKDQLLIGATRIEVLFE